MKSSDEMTKNVFHRIDEYKILRSRRKRTAAKTAVVLGCICIVILAAVGFGKRGEPDNIPAEITASVTTTTAAMSAVTSESGSSTAVQTTTAATEKHTAVQTTASETTTTASQTESTSKKQTTQTTVPTTTAVSSEKTSETTTTPQTTLTTQTTPAGNSAPEPFNTTAQTDTVHYFCLEPGDEVNAPAVLTMISSYGASFGDCETPENGKSCLSESLRGAMAEYGSGCLYRVTVELYRGGTRIAEDSQEASAEIDRLRAAGYTVAFETFYQDQKPVRSWITLHAAFDQINGFPVNTDYGYALYLYDERLK